jgi:hypothetical protein
MSMDALMLWCWESKLNSLRGEVQELRDVINALGSGDREPSLAGLAARKLADGLSVSRPELAAYLGVSTRKIQRMEGAGTLRRCPELGSIVRYSARDVLKLASAR